ncbi:pyrimidine reductase [Mucilaginibacter phyllosphaerae]|nr:pyrimidine reductase [Mucilaginibacter phyllosphaerae]
MTIDGFVAGPKGELDWQFLPGAAPDPNSFKTVIDIAESSDIILLGRKMTREFIDYWENVADNQPDSPMHSFAQTMVNMRKIVFSRTEKNIIGRNLETEHSDLATAVKQLKQKEGKDILVYGGADFVRSLVDLDLIDEYYIIRNPVAIGKGLSIFKERKILNLESTISFKSGKTISKYLPAQAL